ncbi:hypothetical protein A4S06_06230 [Erysipelotrichaceae bacterium MTC7]|nr:hypothetical protein A4S06_06230 [Erysipelotrichaceae bacterium MTC7]
MENMTKQQYITKLSYYLRDMDENEYEDAMNYIQEYFEDAGVENEKSVMAELGSPQKLAATLRAEATIKNVNIKREAAENDLKEEKQKNSTLKTLLIIILGIFALPIALPLAVGMVGLLIGLAASLVALLIALVAGIVALFVVGIPNMVRSVALLGTSFADGLVALGLSFMMVGVAILLTLAIVALIRRFIPWLIHQLSEIFNRNNKRTHMQKEGHIYEEE